MNVRFHTNRDGEPHVYDHGISEREVIEALPRQLEQVAGRNNTTIVIGRTAAGRIIRIIFTDARDGDGIRHYRL